MKNYSTEEIVQLEEEIQALKKSRAEQPSAFVPYQLQRTQFEALMACLESIAKGVEAISRK